MPLISPSDLNITGLGTNGLSNIFSNPLSIQSILQSTEDIRGNIADLTKLYTASQKGQIDSQVLKSFLETKARTLLSKAENLATQAKTNADIKKDQEKTKAITTAYNKETSAALFDTEQYIQDLDNLITPNTSTRLNDINQADIDYHALTGDNQGKFGTPGDIQSRNIKFLNDGVSPENQVSLFPEHNKASIINDMTGLITDDLTLLTQLGYETYNPNTKTTEKIFKSWVKIDANGKASPDIDNTTTLDNTYTDMMAKITQNSNKADYRGSYKFFIEKLHGRYSNGTPYKKNKIYDTSNKKTLPTELTNRMVFSAYINNYNDNYSVESSKYNFIGRAEGFPIYKQTDRNFTVEFMIMADHAVVHMIAMEKLNKNTTAESDQLSALLNDHYNWGLGQIQEPNVKGDTRTGVHIPGMYTDTPDTLWQKVTFLTQCAYPYYRADGKMKEQPMIRVRIGDFYDVICNINQLSYDLNVFDTGIMLDLNGGPVGNVPMAIKVTMNCTVYHDEEPSSTFMGFYWRKEYDSGSIDIRNGDGLLGKYGQDGTKENAKKNSPVDIQSVIQNEGLNDYPAGLDDIINNLNTQVTQFNKSFSTIGTTGIVIKDQILKDNMQKSMLAYKQIDDLVNQLKTEYGDTLTPYLAATSNTTKTAVDNYSNNFNTTVSDSVQKVKNEVQVKPETNLQSVYDDPATVAKNTVSAIKAASRTPKTLGDIF